MGFLGAASRFALISSRDAPTIALWSLVDLRVLKLEASSQTRQGQEREQEKVQGIKNHSPTPGNFLHSDLLVQATPTLRPGELCGFLPLHEEALAFGAGKNEEL